MLDFFLKFLVFKLLKLLTVKIICSNMVWYRYSNLSNLGCTGYLAGPIRSETVKKEGSKSSSKKAGVFGWRSNASEILLIYCLICKRK